MNNAQNNGLPLTAAKVGAGLAALLLAGLLGLLVFVLWVFPQQPLALTEGRLWTVEQGTGFNQLCRQLKSQQVINHCGPLKWYSKFHPELREIKTGSYFIGPDLNHQQLLQLLASGKEHQFAITFVEGERLSQWLERLANAPYLQHRLATAELATPESATPAPIRLDESQLLQRLNAKEAALEGLLFPDTYFYAAGSDSFTIIQRAYLKMQSLIAELWPQRDANLPYQNGYEALIMASIIEKETGAAHERPLIASVFINRLAKKMRLQTDPTVIYGLGDHFDGNLTRQHLAQVTPYNTYRVNGLPPTPIAMPGRESIIAALHPAPTEYYYFVSKKDQTHQFSKTLNEHNAAVRKYQLGQ